MDPLGTQPAQANPQPPVVPPTPNPVSPQPAPAPVAEAQRPTPVTAPVAPAERPVEAWPPAGTPAAQEVLGQQPQTAAAPLPNPSETQSIGIEATQATDLNTGTQTDPPVIAENPAPAATPQDMNGFIVTPAAQEIKNAAANPTNTIMSDQQADKLFQEEPATKARNKKHKINRLVVLNKMSFTTMDDFLYFMFLHKVQKLSFKKEFKLFLFIS